MRVLIIADDRRAAVAVGQALRYAPPCRVMGFLGSHDAGQAVRRYRIADIVVIDERRPVPRTAGLVQEIREAVPAAKLVLLTDDMEPCRLVEVSAAGLDAAVARSAPPPTIGMLIREVAAGRIYHAFQRPLPSASVEAAASLLTSRELEILRLAAGGLPNGNIAARLFVTEQTVKFHLSNVYRKLGLANRTEASHYAHVHGLVESVPEADVRGSIPVAA